MIDNEESPEPVMTRIKISWYFDLHFWLHLTERNSIELNFNSIKKSKMNYRRYDRHWPFHKLKLWNLAKEIIKIRVTDLKLEKILVKVLKQIDNANKSICNISDIFSIRLCTPKWFKTVFGNWRTRISTFKPEQIGLQREPFVNC